VEPPSAWHPHHSITWIKESWSDERATYLDIPDELCLIEIWEVTSNVECLAFEELRVLDRNSFTSWIGKVCGRLCRRIPLFGFGWQRGASMIVGVGHFRWTLVEGLLKEKSRDASVSSECHSIVPTKVYTGRSLLCEWTFPIYRFIKCTRRGGCEHDMTSRSPPFHVTLSGSACTPVWWSVESRC
jgi:hypothetical protein